MNTIRTGLSLAAAAALLAAVPGTAHAETVPFVGSLDIGAHGLPAVIDRGTTVNFVVWYREESPDKVGVLGRGIGLYAPMQGAGSSVNERGVTVSVQDPTTGKWAVWKGESGANTGDYFSWLVKNQFEITPGYWAHLNMRISFSKTAYKGQWDLYESPVEAYQLVNSHGAAVEGYLRFGEGYSTFIVR